ncbi:MAG: hypothetical protein AB7V50_06970 [Vampirovibrionia bacterium]
MNVSIEKTDQSLIIDTTKYVITRHTGVSIIIGFFIIPALVQMVMISKFSTISIALTAAIITITAIAIYLHGKSKIIQCLFVADTKTGYIIRNGIFKKKIKEIPFSNIRQVSTEKIQHENNSTHGGRHRYNYSYIVYLETINDETIQIFELYNKQTAKQTAQAIRDYIV